MAKIPNPLDYVTGAALGRHLRGGVQWPARPVIPKQPPIMLATDPRKKKKPRVSDNAHGY